MKHKFKCRPAEECYRSDPYYTEEVEVEDYGYPRELALLAAARYAEDRCSRRSEYDEFDVQVLTEAGWETFEIHIASVPEFSAFRKRGVPVEPLMVPCRWCDGDVGPAKEVTKTVCDKCEKSFQEEEDGDASEQVG